MAAEFTINTPAGAIRVEEWTDPDYPGITVYRGEDQLAVVECRSYDPSTIAVHVWDDDAVDPIYDVAYVVPAGPPPAQASFVVDTPGGTIAPVLSGENEISVYAKGSMILRVRGFDQYEVAVFDPFNVIMDFITMLDAR